MIVYGCFSRIQKMQGELRREHVTGCTVTRYEQLDTSPDMIEQELRPAVCEQYRCCMVTGGLSNSAERNDIAHPCLPFLHR